MKKILNVLPIIVLAGCVGATVSDNGLTHLKKEPKDCLFLYGMNANATVYSKKEAYPYLEKLILQQEEGGDSYYIMEEKTLENTGAIVGPKNIYKFKVKVYKCEK